MSTIRNLNKGINYIYIYVYITILILILYSTRCKVIGTNQDVYYVKLCITNIHVSNRTPSFAIKA